MIEKEKCQSCGWVSENVECIGIWHCPNAFCRGSGGAWFRDTLKSYKDCDDGVSHTVDDKEWRMKARIYMTRQKMRRFFGLKHNL